MRQAWQEVWSSGSGTARTYCGIAHTGEEYAVDVFHGFTCIESSVFTTREAARAAADAARLRHRPSTASKVARTFSRRVLYMPTASPARASAASRRRTASAAS